MNSEIKPKLRTDLRGNPKGKSHVARERFTIIQRSDPTR